MLIRDMQTLLPALDSQNIECGLKAVIAKLNPERAINQIFGLQSFMFTRDFILTAAPAWIFSNVHSGTLT
jgi:hypothetical protein